MTSEFFWGLLFPSMALLYHKAASNLWKTTQKQDESYNFQTRDGWTLQLHRYKNETPHAPTLLLCHGFAGNPCVWEAGGETSWALELRNAGMDVWSIGLRGTDISQPHAMNTTYGWGWSFREHLEDLRCGLQMLRTRASTKSIHVVGYGMSGHLLAHLLSEQKGSQLSSCIFVGTGFSDALSTQRKWLYQMLRAWPWPFVPLHNMSAWFAPFCQVVPGLLSSFFDEPAEQAKIGWFLQNGVQNVSTTLLREWLEGSQARSVHEDGKSALCQEENFELHVPCLLIGGSADKIVPAEAVQSFYNKLQAPQKKLSLVGIDFGSQQEYGHLDLLHTSHFGRDLLPLLQEWLSTTDRSSER